MVPAWHLGMHARLRAARSALHLLQGRHLPPPWGSIRGGGFDRSEGKLSMCQPAIQTVWMVSICCWHVDLVKPCAPGSCFVFCGSLQLHCRGWALLLLGLVVIHTATCCLVCQGAWPAGCSQAGAVPALCLPAALVLSIVMAKGAWRLQPSCPCAERATGGV